jgi:hypothetical protein
MTTNSKIRRFLAKGKSADYIAKTLGINKNRIYTARWKDAQKEKQKTTQVERNHDPKETKAEKEYIKKIEALYKKPDLVNHPLHYKVGGIEVIDFIESKDLNYRLGNVVKYISRAGKKDSDPVQDLEKAAWYLQREIVTRKRA